MSLAPEDTCPGLRCRKCTYVYVHISKYKITTFLHLIKMVLPHVKRVFCVETYPLASSSSVTLQLYMIGKNEKSDCKKTLEREKKKLIKISNNCQHFHKSNVTCKCTTNKLCSYVWHRHDSFADNEMELRVSHSNSNTRWSAKSFAMYAKLDKNTSDKYDLGRKRQSRRKRRKHILMTKKSLDSVRPSVCLSVSELHVFTA